MSLSLYENRVTQILCNSSHCVLDVSDSLTLTDRWWVREVVYQLRRDVLLLSEGKEKKVVPVPGL